MTTQVLKKKPDFREKPWPTISASAKDFVKKLLVKDAFARLTAAQALCTFSTVSCSCNLLGGMSKKITEVDDEVAINMYEAAGLELDQILR